MKQKNKTYEQPEMEVVKLETQPLLTGSQVEAGMGEGTELGC